MRQTMGRFIDGLDPEQRDRLITAREFNDGNAWFGEGCGCLVGTAYEDDYLLSQAYRDFKLAGAAWFRAHPECRGGLLLAGTLPWSMAPAAARYPKAVHRFGRARVVRAVKLRAARLNRSDASSIARLVGPLVRVAQERAHAVALAIALIIGRF